MVTISKIKQMALAVLFVAPTALASRRPLGSEEHFNRRADVLHDRWTRALSRYEELTLRGIPMYQPKLRKKELTEDDKAEWKRIIAGELTRAGQGTPGFFERMINEVYKQALKVYESAPVVLEGGLSNTEWVKHFANQARTSSPRDWVVKPRAE